MIRPFNTIPIEECGDPLIDLSEYPFVLEPVYFKQGFSPEQKMFLRKKVADMLVRAQQRIAPYRFKIWDGYRPRVVQITIYQNYWNELEKEHPDWDSEQIKKRVEIYVFPGGDPGWIPPHSTGGTVDLTLVDQEGNELDMGTGFDHFGDEAGADYFEDSEHPAKKNRAILRDVMIAERFTPEPAEWWHFDYGNQKWARNSNNDKAIFGEIKSRK